MLHLFQISRKKEELKLNKIQSALGLQSMWEKQMGILLAVSDIHKRIKELKVQQDECTVSGKTI